MSLDKSHNLINIFPLTKLGSVSKDIYLAWCLMPPTFYT
jgi:hypothetical protein